MDVGQASNFEIPSQFTKKKPEYHGTIVPHPDFNPRMDAVVLEKAINSKSKNHSVLVSF